MRMLIRTALLTTFVVFAGCATNPQADGVASTQPHAECLVCKYNADLACINIPIEKDTPRYVLDGKTYYFCSDSCRDKFAKEPAKYLAAK